MQLFHLYNRNKLVRLIHSKMWMFEFSIWLHTFSRSLVSIFIPILLLKSGYSVNEVILFYFLYNVIDVPLNFLARWCVRKIGARNVVILGTLFSIGFFVCLFNISANNWALLIKLAVFAALYDTFYWVAHLYLFVKCSNKKNDVASDASGLSIARRLAGLMAPALGALVLILSNQDVLISVSIVLLSLSLLPLLRIKGIPDKPLRKQKSFRSFFKSWKITKDFLSVGFFGIHSSVEGIIWPIFIFTYFESVESVAILPIIASITSIIFTYFVGKTTKSKRSLLIAVGGIAISFVWILRLFVTADFFYFFSVFLVGIFAVFISLPLDSSLLEKGEKRDLLSASTYRNIASMSANVLLYGTLCLLINIFDASFYIAALSTLLVVFTSYLIGQVFLKERFSLKSSIPVQSDNLL